MRLSLRWRLVALCVALQLGALALAGGFAVEEARRAVREEIEAGQRSARALTLAANAALRAAMPEREALRALPEALPPMRHVRVAVLDAELGPLPGPQAPAPARPAPAWFAALVAPPPTETRLPILREGRTLGWVAIATAPQDELASAWAWLRGLSLVGLGLIALTAAAVAMATGRALAPLHGLGETVEGLESGDFTRRAPAAPGPDLRPLAARIDRLAAGLETAETARRRLDRRLVEIQDEERRLIARELHDELGPCIFGLRAAVDGLERTVPGAEAGAAPMRAIMDHLEGVGRRMPTALRPTAVGQLPLAEVLEDLVASCRMIAPGVRFELDLAPLPEPDETAALTLYRLVQEGTTNALRHGGASRIRIALRREGGDACILVEDDGTGLAPGAAEGRGILGMRERARALGGALRITPGEGGAGLRLSLRLPLPEEDRAADEGPGNAGRNAA